MNDQQIDIKIIFDRISKKEELRSSFYSGIVILTPKIEVTVDSMNINLNLRITGRMSPENDLLQSTYLLENSKLLNKDQKYEFPFEIKVDEGIATYNGKNASIQQKLEVTINIKPEDYSKIKPGLLSSLKTFVTNNTSIKSFKFININETEKRYKVETGEYELSRKFIYWLSFVFSVFTAPVIFYILPNFETPNVVIGVVTSLLIGFISQMIYLHYTHRDVSVELTNNDDDTFSVKVNLGNEGRNHKPEFYYHIYEKVVDRRGTSNTTYKEKIYTSEVKSQGGLYFEDLKFKFPERTSLSTLSLSSLDIYWVLYARSKDSFGLESIHEVEFIVQKVLQ